MAAKRKAGALLQHVLPKDNLTPEPDLNDDDNYGSRNGDATDGAGAGGADSMADLWASYHSALGLASKPAKMPTPHRDQTSPIHGGSVTSVVDPTAHEETSSSAGGTGKDDDDPMLGGSDEDSDDRVDPHHHDPERLKAFNMFVRLFVDENLDRIVPISKQPKEKIQAIIDSCTRQFPEFAERARKRIRTYLKSCRRNKKVRGEVSSSGSTAAAAGVGNAWDAAVRPTPAHLTSVQAEHILAQACENESLNAKRMRLGLDPVSQPMPTVPVTVQGIDTTASSAAASSFLSLYSAAAAPASSAAAASAPLAPSHSKALADSTRPTASPTLDPTNNNSFKHDNANGHSGSKTASPSSSPAPVFRPTFSAAFGTPQPFGRPSSSSSTVVSPALSSTALLSTLTSMPPTGGVSMNAAAVAAYQSAILSAMAAHSQTFPGIAAPTDLSMKNVSTSTPLHSISSSSNPSSLPGSTSAVGTSTGKPPLLTHKLSGAEVGAVRQLITGYRESAAFLLRSADELEALLLQQP